MQSATTSKVPKQRSRKSIQTPDWFHANVEPHLSGAFQRVLDVVNAAPGGAGITAFDLIYPQDAPSIPLEICEALRWKFPININSDDWLLPHAILNWHRNFNYDYFRKSPQPLESVIQHYSLYLALRDCLPPAAWFVLKHGIPLGARVRMSNHTWLPRGTWIDIPAEIERRMTEKGAKTRRQLLTIVANTQQDPRKRA